MLTYSRSWDYTFELTPDHPTPESMKPLKFSYDKLGEDCFNRINEISPPPSAGLPRSNGHQWTQDVKKDEQKAHRDLYLILKEHADSDDVLNKLWIQVNNVPEWVDWDQLARGQDVFYRYGWANLTGLTYQSLLGGMGAARVVETLARTGGFSTKVARRRLYETTQHILQVTKSIEAIQPGGEGWAATIRVRLLHAAVRARIMKLAKERPSYYNVEELGVPINDLDSIATIGTFSATLIWFALPRQGVFLHQQEIKDYLALWRYVAYIIGCPDEIFADYTTSRQWIESLLHYEIKPSDMSIVLANNIIKALERRPPLYTSREMLVATARWLNGNTLCDRLGLERPPFYYRLLVAGQCFFSMFMAYSNRYSPWFDTKQMAFLRKAYWVMIVEHNTGLEGKQTVFDFKYVPEFSTLTEMDDSSENAEHHGRIEMRNLKYLVIGSAAIIAGVVSGVKLTTALFRLVWR